MEQQPRQLEKVEAYEPPIAHRYTARLHGSENDGPEDLDRVMVHAMGEFVEFGEEDLPAYDVLERYGLSAHALVHPSGVITRMVPDGYIASHARGFNHSHYGIEFLVPGVHTLASLYDAMDQDNWLTEAQFKAGAWQVATWLRHQALEQTVHRHDMMDPRRKRDPGKGFPWESFLARVKMFIGEGQEAKWA